VDAEGEVDVDREASAIMSERTRLKRESRGAFLEIARYRSTLKSSAEEVQSDT
jgi:hypothetical protein